MQNATKNSLLILDEVGRGTSTYDGLSIAWAVIEHLTDKISLTHISTFACHIGAGENHSPVFVFVKQSIVGDKPFFGNTFDYGMTPFLNFKRLKAFKHFGTDVFIGLRYHGKA